MSKRQTGFNKKKTGKNQSKNMKRNGSDYQVGREFTLRVPKSTGTIIPDRMITTLRWWKSVSISLASVSTNAIRFSPSSAQDPDPVGTAQPLGFAQMAALYNSYRVLRSSASAETVNTGNVPITTTLLPSNTDPGPAPSPGYVTASRLQAFAVSKTGALAGGPLCRVSTSMTTQKMYGNKMIQFDDNFAALVNTVPGNNWYWVVALYAPAVAPNAVILNFYMDIEIEFYDRASQVQT